MLPTLADTPLKDSGGVGEPCRSSDQLFIRGEFNPYRLSVVGELFQDTLLGKEILYLPISLLSTYPFTIVRLLKVILITYYFHLLL